MERGDRQLAREMVRGEIEKMLRRWEHLAEQA